MHPLRSLSNAFVYFFGITPPTQKAANRTGGFIAILLVLVVVAVAVVATIMLHLTFPH